MNRKLSTLLVLSLVSASTLCVQAEISFEATQEQKCDTSIDKLVEILENLKSTDFGDNEKVIGFMVERAQKSEHELDANQLKLDTQIENFGFILKSNDMFECATFTNDFYVETTTAILTKLKEILLKKEAKEELLYKEAKEELLKDWDHITKDLFTTYTKEIKIKIMNISLDDIQIEEELSIDISGDEAGHCLQYKVLDSSYTIGRERLLIQLGDDYTITHNVPEDYKNAGRDLDKLNEIEKLETLTIQKTASYKVPREFPYIDSSDFKNLKIEYKGAYTDDFFRPLIEKNKGEDQKNILINTEIEECYVIWDVNEKQLLYIKMGYANRRLIV